jgi:hypothetical protein
VATQAQGSFSALGQFTPVVGPLAAGVTIVGGHERRNTATWMTDGLAVIGEKKLCHLAIPGTHNSATYTLTEKSDYAVDQLTLMKLSLPARAASSVIAKWSKTQDRDIMTQLNDGIRYFDIRVGYHKNTFYICHGMRGESIPQLLATIMEFSRKYPHEVVIIDFNHFYELGNAEHEMLCQLITGFVQGKLWTFANKDITLNQAKALGVSIVVVYHIDEGQNYGFFHKTAIDAPWHNTDVPTELKRKLAESLYSRKAEATQLYVSQCILTPHGDTVVSHITSTLASLAGKLNEQVYCSGWLTEFHERSPVNVVMLDHYHTHKLADLIISFNFAPPRVTN